MSTPNGKNFSRLKSFRKIVGLSQTELGFAARVAQPHISKFESGKERPWPAARKRLSRALGVSEYELFPPIEGKHD